MKSQTFLDSDSWGIYIQLLLFKTKMPIIPLQTIQPVLGLQIYLANVRFTMVEWFYLGAPRIPIHELKFKR